jgi:hypothetical protein
MILMPKLLRDAQNLREGLVTESATLMLFKKILGESQTLLPLLLQELRIQLPIILGYSKNLREAFTP